MSDKKPYRPVLPCHTQTDIEFLREVFLSSEMFQEAFLDFIKKLHEETVALFNAKVDKPEEVPGEFDDPNM